MTSAILALALLSQCPGGSCSLPTTAYYPQFVVPRVQAAPAPPQLWYPAYRPVQVWRQPTPAYYRVPVAHRNGLRLFTPAGGR